MKDEKPLVYFVAGIINCLYTILLVMLLWNWFVVPLGVVKIGFWWAMGLYCLIAVLMDGSSSLDKNNSIEFKDMSFSKGFYVRTLILLIGYLCSFSVG